MSEIMNHPVAFALLFPFIPEPEGYEMLGAIVDETLGNEPSTKRNLGDRPTSIKVALAAGMIFKTILFAALAATLASAVIHFAVTPCMGYLIDAAIISASAYAISAIAFGVIKYMEHVDEARSNQSEYN